VREMNLNGLIWLLFILNGVMNIERISIYVSLSFTSRKHCTVPVMGTCRHKNILISQS
jgi:hypothetical protein